MVDNRLWPAGAAAFGMHSLVLATLALGMNSSHGVRQNIPSQDFCMEVAFTMAEEGAVAQEQDQQTPELGQLEKGLKNTRQPVQKIALHKALRREFTSLKVQKNSHQGFGIKGDAMPVYNPAPPYPQKARRQKIQGVVLARLSLSPAGSVEKIAILPPRTDPALEEAVLWALPHWRFVPGAQVVDIPIEFRLMSPY